MTKPPPTLEAEVQQVLDELWSEKLIPFELSVGKITREIGEYTIHFHDSRMSTAIVPLTEKHSSRDIIRSAVLARVARVSGPLKNREIKGRTESFWSKSGNDEFEAGSSEFGL
jgi:hypothetical protein